MTQASIVVVDYGIGNLSSIRNMLNKVGCRDVVVSPAADVIAGAHKLILPGVGAFDHGMANLNQGERVEALNEAALRRRVPVLGICLGMQLMCGGSEEGDLRGLGWLDAQVRRFQPPAASGLKVPHMGWNTLAVKRQNPLLATDPIAQRRFYFVHSYHVVCTQQRDVLATTHYGYDFAAAFNAENIYGVQFHPEKSHRFGMELMKRFVEL
jgi:imidazole glycerol-phosphate synthase subunit HisH